MLPKVLISQYSQALDRLMNGGMSETANESAELKDVDEHTFICFAQWLYYGRYDLHQSSESGNEPSTRGLTPWDAGLTLKEKRAKEKSMKLNGTWENRVVQMPNAVDVYWGGSMSWGDRGTKKQEGWQHFTEQSKYVLGPPPRTNNKSNYADFTEIFLGHAKLYTFADKWGIASLAELCLENLKISLIECDCWDDQIPSVVDLLIYTLHNTPSLDTASILNSTNLRSMVLDFVVIIYESIVEDRDFKQLLDSEPEFVKELLLKFPQRLD